MCAWFSSKCLNYLYSLVVDPRFDIHKVFEGNEIDLRIETGSSILDDTSTLAGSVLYTGGSDTSTIQGGEIQVYANDDPHDDRIPTVDDVMRHFDNSIKVHQDQEEVNSIRSVSSSSMSSKCLASRRMSNTIAKPSARSISRQISFENRKSTVRNRY